MGFKPGNSFWRSRKKYNGEGGIGIDGYRRVTVSSYRRVREHRAVMEKYLGRKLLRNEHVHHKDGDRTNNKIENLEILTANEHSRHHYKLRKINKYGQFI